MFYDVETKSNFEEVKWYKKSLTRQFTTGIISRGSKWGFSLLLLDFSFFEIKGSAVFTWANAYGRAEYIPAALSR